MKRFPLFLVLVAAGCGGGSGECPAPTDLDCSTVSALGTWRAGDGSTLVLREDCVFGLATDLCSVIGRYPDLTNKPSGSTCVSVSGAQPAASPTACMATGSHSCDYTVDHAQDTFTFQCQGVPQKIYDFVSRSTDSLPDSTPPGIDGGIIPPWEPPDASLPPDATPFVCNDDGLYEDNGSTDDATNTALLGDGSFNLNASICPGTDTDYYRFAAEEGFTNITVTLTVSQDSTDSGLALEILNDVGGTIRVGTADGLTISSGIPNAPGGTYFVKVSASAQANYNIDITLSSF